MKTSCRKIGSTLLLQAVLLFPAFANAQNKMSDHIWLDTTFYLPKEVTGTGTEITCARHGGDILFSAYNARKDADTMRFYLVKIDSLRIMEKKMVMSGMGKRLFAGKRDGIDQLAFDGRNVYMTIGGTLYKCHFDTPDDIIFDWAEKITLPFGYMYLIDDSTLLFSRCRVSNSKKIPETLLFTYDIPSKRVLHQVEPAFCSVLLSLHEPYKHMDVWDGKVLWANRNDYSFHIYNRQLEVVDSIIGRNVPLDAIKEDTLEEVGRRKLNGIDLIDAMGSLYMTHDRVDFVYYVNDSNIAAVRTLKNDFQTLLDWWQKTDNGWTLKFEGIQNPHVFSSVGVDEIIGTNHFHIGWISSGRVIVTEDKFIIIDSKGLPINPVGMTRKEYVKATNDWLLDNDTHITVTILQHDFAK